MLDVCTLKQVSKVFSPSWIYNLIVHRNTKIGTDWDFRLVWILKKNILINAASIDLTFSLLLKILWKGSSQATCSIFWWTRAVQWQSAWLPKLPILLKSASCPLWPHHTAVRGGQVSRCSLPCLCQGLWQGGYWDNPEEAEIIRNTWEPWQLATELPQWASSVCSSERKDLSAQSSTIRGTTGVSLRAPSLSHSHWRYWQRHCDLLSV